MADVFSLNNSSFFLNERGLNGELCPSPSIHQLGHFHTQFLFIISAYVHAINEILAELAVSLLLIFLHFVNPSPLPTILGRKRP
jgi:hypothetical protein